MTHWMKKLFGQITPTAQAREDLRQARLSLLEAAMMRESWTGFERTLKGRIARLEKEVGDEHA